MLAESERSPFHSLPSGDVYNKFIKRRNNIKAPIKICMYLLCLSVLNGCVLECHNSCNISVNSFWVQMELYQNGPVSFSFCGFLMCDLLMGPTADHKNWIHPRKIYWIQHDLNHLFTLGQQTDINKMNYVKKPSSSWSWTTEASGATTPSLM